MSAFILTIARTLKPGKQGYSGRSEAPWKRESVTYLLNYIEKRFQKSYTPTWFRES